MLDGFGGEAVHHNDRRIQGCEIDLVYLLVHTRLRLGHYASLVAGPQIGDVPHGLSVSLSEWHSHAPAKGFEDLVAGGERAGRDAGGEVRGEAGEPGGH